MLPLFRKFKYAPGDLVENNHPCECPLDHSEFTTDEVPTRVFRVKLAFFEDGHECLAFEGFQEESYFCSGTFRHVRPSSESVEDMCKKHKQEKKKEPVYGWVI